MTIIMVKPIIANLFCFNLLHTSGQYLILGLLILSTFPSSLGPVEHPVITIIVTRSKDIIVINLMNAPAIDATGVILLGKIQEKLEEMDKRLILTGLREDTYEKLVKLDILDGSEKTINLGRIAQAISYARELATEKDEIRGYALESFQNA